MTQDISKYASRTVGEIVADNYAAADVFHHFGVDFCCHGSDNYLEAVGKANAKLRGCSKALWKHSKSICRKKSRYCSPICTTCMQPSRGASIRNLSIADQWLCLST